MQYFTPDTAFPILGFVAVLLTATVVHELGHLVVAWLLGIPVRRIAVGLGPTLWRRQGAAEREFVLRAFPVGVTVGVPGRRAPDGTLRRPPWQDFLMAAGGPAASLLLFVALAAAAGPAQTSPVLLSWFRCIAMLSVFLGLANLIPLPGLDGGHMLVLGASAVGLRLSGEREAALHRLGFRLAAVACVAFAVGRVVVAAAG
jgi:membrane-associated protease RseP (regulator of RpoE activity)